MISPASEFLNALAASWRRERATARARAVAARREIPLAERVARGMAARDLAVDELDAAAGGRVLLSLIPKRPGDLDGFRGGPGDPVRLWRERPDEEDAVRAVLGRRRAGRLTVVVDAERAGDVDDPGAGRFHLDVDDDEETFLRGERAIARFVSASDGSDAGRLREVLLGNRPPRFEDRAVPRWFDGALNAPQRDAVARAAAARDVALVHGPPGTGKTRTLVEVVRQALASGERVLAAAASNAAVDHLAAGLDAAGVPVVRLGHPARVSSRMEARTLDALLAECGAFDLVRSWQREAADIRRRARTRFDRGQIDRRELAAAMRDAGALSRDARKQLAGAQAAILEGARVVCATAAGADAALLGDATFDLLVLDEATQAADPIALVAMARARRVVLAGDPRQLPPTVIDPEAAREGLATTLFERLAARDPALPRMLTVQHRMHAAIMAFPSASMYGGHLEAEPSVASHRLEDLGLPADPLRPGPWHFVDTAGKGWTEEREREDPSTHNPGQAGRVAAEARRLLGRGLPPRDLAVIAPYDAQVRRLRDLLAAEVAAGLEIGSVDGFQGREKEAVLVDLVRSNDEGELGFLGDTRRMNVALTRARRFLLVVGDSATLGGHGWYRAFLEAAESSGAWLSAWADEAPPFE